MLHFLSCCPPDGDPPAQRSAARRRRRQTPVVDIHCHLRNPECEPLVRDLFKVENDPYLLYTTAETREINQRLLERVVSKLTTPAERIADMDRMGVDIQVLSPSPFQYYYWTDGELGLRLARMQNDHIAQVVRSYPERFAGIGTVPLQDPARAALELNRIVGDLGLGGVEISSNVNGKDLDAPEFEPFFAEAERLGALLFMHPLGFSHGERLREYFLNNTLAQPLESTVAVSRLIFSGVLERHAGLKLCIAHGGGFLPYYSGRFDRAYQVRAECQKIPQPPTHYLRRLYFDTVIFTPETLADLARFAGADHILLGTDYPFDMGESDPVGLVAKVRPLSKAAREAICGGNALKLLGRDGR